MQKSVLIESIETISCDAGWRNYYFIKLKTDNGVVGWSEYDESFGPLGVTQNIKNIVQLSMNNKNSIKEETLISIKKENEEMKKVNSELIDRLEKLEFVLAKLKEALTF